MMKTEKRIEDSFIDKLKDLKYIYREDIKDRVSLEANFREHFQRLNKVNLSNSEFARLKDGIITADVFTAAKTLREINTFVNTVQLNPVKAATPDRREPCPLVQFPPKKIDSPQNFRVGCIFRAWRSSFRRFREVREPKKLT